MAVSTPGTRQLKVAREIQRDLAEIIRGKGMGFFGGAMVTVSIFPSEMQAPVMGILADNNRLLRGELGHQVGKQLRIVPELDFYLDTTLDYAQHIEELLKK